MERELYLTKINDLIFKVVKVITRAFGCFDIYCFESENEDVA
jgi:hypothetical protein